MQVDGPISFAFETQIADPIPTLSDPEVRALVTKSVDPVFPFGVLSTGQAMDVVVSVNEVGKLTGESFPGVPSAAAGPIDRALTKWTFTPLIRDGKPQYFHGTLHFVVR